MESSLLEELAVLQLVQNFLCFMEPEGSLRCLHCAHLDLILSHLNLSHDRATSILKLSCLHFILLHILILF